MLEESKCLSEPISSLLKDTKDLNKACSEGYTTVGDFIQALLLDRDRCALGIYRSAKIDIHGVLKACYLNIPDKWVISVFSEIRGKSVLDFYRFWVLGTSDGCKARFNKDFTETVNRVLNDREKEAIKLRFGESKIFVDIGEVLEVSSTRARDIVKKAVSKLKKNKDFYTGYRLVDGVWLNDIEHNKYKVINRLDGYKSVLFYKTGFNWSDRVIKSLYCQGINTVEDVLSLSIEDALNLRCMGRKGLYEISEFREYMGYERYSYRP